ncbi:MAG TPA: tRNA preQ1(34) S-adenosylmethionine ribosyltransferase-isomerase QueA [Nitrospira sp.]|nr:tRNA preQ1(34) S-adenosylmethionine ribosyltransferase-isomerase QueA [Nitrospira sp.]
MELSEFDFPFDPALIASEPVLPRDHARLFVLDRASGTFAHHRVSDLPHLLGPRDLLVVNDTKVRPARVVGRKRPSGARVELLFVKERSDGSWDVLLKGRFRPGQSIDLSPEDRVVVRSREEGATVVTIESSLPRREFFRRFGSMPLPPYIKRMPSEMDQQWYQTMFAEKEGAIAAPTAGLHFTGGLLERLRQRGVDLVTVTLHVGIGTFKPVTVEKVEEHQMAPEWVEVAGDTLHAVAQTRKAGRRVVAVGTTVVRALEAASRGANDDKPFRGETNLFITPGHAFRSIDALITNFHFPKTTLLMLVSAFAGTALLKRAYNEAVRERYRFYSYGDAMLIL